MGENARDLGAPLMRLIARLKSPIAESQICDLQIAGAKLLFRSRQTGIIGFEVEDSRSLQACDFLLESRPSQRGQVLLHPALFAAGVSGLHQQGLTGSGVSIAVREGDDRRCSRRELGTI